MVKPVKLVTKGKGFRLPSKTGPIEFDNPEYQGIEVIARLRVPLGFYFSLQELVESEPKKAFQLFGDKVLVAWNLVYGEDDQDKTDEPIPATGNGMLEADPDLANSIISAWRKAVEGVPAPLVEE